MALAMTDGVAGQAATHQELAAYYDAHADGWLDVAAQWSFSANCGSGYYANHIAFIMAYVWARLETDAARGARIATHSRRQDVGGAERAEEPVLRVPVGRDAHAPPAAATIATPTPSWRSSRRGRACTSPSTTRPTPSTCRTMRRCTSEPMADTATNAVDVRRSRHRGLLVAARAVAPHDAGNAAEVYPGVDFLAAYWAARAGGFVGDDAPRRARAGRRERRRRVVVAFPERGGT